MSTFAETISNAFMRMQLGTTERARIYHTLKTLLDNNIMIADALGEMYAVASDDGRKPSRAEAVLLYECRRKVSEGQPLTSALSKWVSIEEANIIASGEKAGQLGEAFDEALALIERQKAMKAAVRGGVAYPAALFAVLGVLLWIITNKLVPALSSAAPPDTWTGAARMMYLVATFVTHYGLFCVIAGGLFVAFALFSLPRLKGDMRFRLERIPPWSVYRLIVGATFLLNVAVLVRAGIKLHDALIMLRGTATPYLAERIDGAILGTTKGKNLGVALRDAGYDFPDREAVKYITLLASREGFADALVKYANAWLDDATRKVKSAMQMVFYVAIIGVGACAAMIILAGTEIQSIIQTQAQ